MNYKEVRQALEVINNCANADMSIDPQEFYDIISKFIDDVEKRDKKKLPMLLKAFDEGD